jgi:hypothetical protein
MVNTLPNWWAVNHRKDINPLSAAFDVGRPRRHRGVSGRVCMGGDGGATLSSATLRLRGDYICVQSILRSIPLITLSASLYFDAVGDEVSGEQ